MRVTAKISVDLRQPNTGSRVDAVQHDVNTRAVEISLFDGGAAWLVPEGVTVAVGYKKPDDKKGLYDKLPDGTAAAQISGSVITIVLAPQMLTTPGTVNACIVLTDADLNQLTSFPFWVRVEANPAAGAIASEDYYKYSTMADVSAAVDAWLQEAETAKTDFLAKAEEALAVVHGAATEDAPAIVCEASGTVIALDDASDRLLQGLRIYGRTTQDGTPAPEAPVELVSVGDGESVAATIASAQMFNVGAKGNTTLNGITYTVDQVNGTISAKGTNSSASTTYFQYSNKMIPLSNGRITISGCPSGNSNVWIQFYNINGAGGIARDTGNGVTFDFTNSGGEYNIAFGVAPGATVDVVFKPMLNYGSAALPWEPYTVQTLPISTPNGLPGIPVSSGGNYTDADGQQWVCDEIDLARGVYVQRIGKKTIEEVTWGFNGTNFYSTNFSDKKIGQLNIKCSHYAVSSEAFASADKICRGSTSERTVYIRDSSYTTQTDLKSAVGDGVFLYELETPIETPIPEDELAAYAAIHTNKPNTTIYNDAGAHMNVEYVADTKLYIDKQINALAAAIVNNT